MSGKFLSPDGDLEDIFLNITDYDAVDAQSTSGTLWMWGNNAYGAFGNNAIASVSSPVQTVSLGNNWSYVAAGAKYTLGIKSNGTLWAWGYNLVGELGLSNITNYSSPMQVGTNTNWAMVAAGGGTLYYSIGIKTDGTLWTWGQAGPQLGVTGTATSYSSPVQTLAGGSTWKYVSAGGVSVGAIKNDGTLWVWGANGTYQLGTGNTTAQSSAVQTILGGNTWKTVVSNSTSSSPYMGAIKADGSLWTWGGAAYGQTGHGDVTTRSTPTQVMAGTDPYAWRSIGSGNQAMYGIKKDGTLWAWGRAATVLMVPDGTSTDKYTPVQEATLSTNWKRIGRGNGNYSHGAVKADGTLWMWGRGTGGYVGQGTASSVSTPVQTACGGTNWKHVTTGYNHAAAICYSDPYNLYPNK
jgi:alpha-tubulin suppressor-like RCC1 family protein